ncbi:SRPBCC family protein [Actinocrinis sp.]|uniref:SRPBCC family protein n=1 Tax=Actinocrinis sp. TaxID=1920516 RepID=UPI002D23127E|nr:SRPBCC family protein [Actinocrinis sp.]HZP51481.1 SRPBCC family protein [Actinocrinis sp.]
MVLAALVVLGVLVMLIAVVLVTGRLLPVKHQASRRVQLGQSPQAVWDTITDVEGLPAWRPGLMRVELLPEQAGRTRWREYDRHNKITFEVAEAIAPTRLVTRIVDPDLPFGGTWTYEIAPAPDGCIVTVTEDGEVYSPLFRFVSRYVMGHTATLDRNLKALTRRFGENAAIRGV